MKQLEREDSGFDFHQRNRKIQRFDHDRFQDGEVQFTTDERTHRTQADFRQRASGKARDFRSSPWLDRFRNEQTTVGGETIEERRREADRRRAARA
jgi:hypothetical protein